MGMVVTYAPGDGDGVTQHEIAARVAIARTLAALKGFEFGGGYEPSLRRNGQLYFVPSQTLEVEEARELGIRGEHDLFGGVPAGTIVHFRGVDRRAGPITKYTVLEPYERSL